MFRRFLVALAALALATAARADFFTPPGGAGGGSSTGLPPGWASIQSAPYNASGLNTTGQGAITASSTALGLEYALNLANGMGINVVGAGAAGADLITTVISGGGTNSIVVANAAGTSKLSGTTVKAIGSMSIGTNVLNLASPAGWAVGQGIDVHGAGTAGADLITSVTAVGQTSLTLAATAITGTTNGAIDHDDTAAWQAASNSGLNFYVPAGQYNWSSTVNFIGTQWFQCPSAGLIIPSVSFPFPPNIQMVVVWNRGSANNVVNVTGSTVRIDSCGFEQAPDVTPTAGYGLVTGSGAAATLIYNDNINLNSFYNFYQLWWVNQGLNTALINGNQFQSGSFTAGTTTNPMETYDDTQPSGDNKITNNNFQDSTGLNKVGISFIHADTNFWTNNNWTGCSYCIYVGATAPSANDQFFIGSSIEGSGNESHPLVYLGAGKSWSFVGGEFASDNAQGAIFQDTNNSNLAITGNNYLPSVTTPTVSNSFAYTYSGNYDNNNGGQGSNFSFNGLTASPTFITSGGTPVGNTGSCTATGIAGGISGVFTAPSCAGGTIILTGLTGSFTGYACTANDTTTPTDSIREQSSTASSVTFKATTAASDIVYYVCMGY